MSGGSALSAINPMFAITGASAVAGKPVVDSLAAMTIGGAMGGKPPEASKIPAPPTMEDASKSAEMITPKTYGRSGTFKTMGGQRGLASSLLNLSSPSLVGK